MTLESFHCSGETLSGAQHLPSWQIPKLLQRLQTHGLLLKANSVPGEFYTEVIPEGGLKTKLSQGDDGAWLFDLGEGSS